MSAAARTYTWFGVSGQALQSLVQPGSQVTGLSAVWVKIAYDDAQPGIVEALDEFMFGLGYLWDDDAGRDLNVRNLNTGAVVGIGVLPSGALKVSGSPVMSSVLDFSGVLTGLVLGNVERFLANGSSEVTAALSYRAARPLRFADLAVQVNANALVSATTLELLVNGAASGLAVNIPAGFTGAIAVEPGPVDIDAGDSYDLRLTNTNGGVGILRLSATLEAGFR